MTPLFTASELIEATGGTLANPFSASGVSIDTRTLKPGELFVALVGDGRDGHAFVADAIAKGTAGAMVHKGVPGTERLLRVDDTLAGLARLGGFARQRFSGQVVAVTGSVGKTTTKEMLRTAFTAFGTTHAAVASYNNHWGLPLTLARIPHGARYCIVEIGMNHAGEIAPLARLARPHVALISAVEKAHVGHLGSIEAIADEKAAIMQGLEPHGIAVLPADSPHYGRLRAAAGSARIISYGTGPAADVRLVEIDADADGSRLLIDAAGREIRMRLNAPGAHMAMNATAALGAVLALGLDPVIAAGALETFAPVAGRGTRRVVAMPAGGVLLLDESYNGNGASMRAALEVLRLQPAKRRIAVLGDMLELGADGPDEHAALAASVACAADGLFVCGSLMRYLFDAVPAPLRCAHTADSATLAPLVAASLAEGDAVLVKGSLGSRMKLVVDALDALATPPASVGTPGLAGAA
jgi:UDP-N-acetylmuramoyl-tripeptide--D-alanyl-D-alanine ligase